MWKEQGAGGGGAAAYPKFTGTQVGGQRREKAILPMDRCSPDRPPLISASRGGFLSQTGTDLKDEKKPGPADPGSWHWETQASFETKYFLPHPY